MAMTFIIHDVNSSSIFSTNSETFTGVSEESCEVFQLFKSSVFYRGNTDGTFALSSKEGDGPRESNVVIASCEKFKIKIKLITVLAIVVQRTLTCSRAIACVDINSHISYCREVQYNKERYLFPFSHGVSRWRKLDFQNCKRLNHAQFFANVFVSDGNDLHHP
jgi:hypothetical protein